MVKIIMHDGRHPWWAWCIRHGANDGDEDKTLDVAHNAPNDDGHPDNCVHADRFLTHRREGLK